jgi:fatty-acyl-CoA synthase
MLHMWDPQPHTQAKVVDANGRALPCGAPGELLVRGYLVTDGGCWRDPTSTVMSIDSEGWMHTGDLAVLDADGFANILGRQKDLIIRGGGAFTPQHLTWSTLGVPPVCCHPGACCMHCHRTGFAVPNTLQPP